MLAKLVLGIVLIVFTIWLAGMVGVFLLPNSYHCTDYEMVHELNGCHGQGHFP